MSQEKTAEIIDLEASRAIQEGDHAGAFLASARHGAGLDVRVVAEATKIRPEHIEAIEAGDAAGLPATPYAVGFVKVYAQFLGLDAEAVAAEFKKEITRARPAPPEPERDVMPISETSDGVKLASLVGIVLILAFAVWIVFQIAGNAERESRAAEEAGPSVTVSTERAEAPRPRIVVRPEAKAVSGEDAVAEQLPAENAETQTVEGSDQQTAPVEDEDVVASASEATTPSATAPVPLAEDQAGPSGNETEAPSTLAPAIAAPSTLEELTPAPNIIDARLSRSIGPQYPNRCARGAEELESVSLIFDVTTAGRPANIRVSSATNECFNDAAIAAIDKWRFDARTVNGAAAIQPGLSATLNFRK